MIVCISPTESDVNETVSLNEVVFILKWLFYADTRLRICNNIATFKF